MAAIIGCRESIAVRDDARVERRGKSSPVDWRQLDPVNSIRSNTVEGTKACPAVPEEVA